MTLAEHQTTGYEADYVLWLEATVERLRRGDYDRVDWENLLDEIEGMARSERRALKNNLIVLIVHLLKWQFQPQCRSGSWAGSITEHRSRLLGILEDSPSLKSEFSEVLPRVYVRGQRQASDETGLPLDTFPATCPYTADELLDDGFWPGGKGDR